jgi:hypothetical protein
VFVKSADLMVNLGNDPPPKLAARYKIALEMIDPPFDKPDEIH